MKYPDSTSTLSLKSQVVLLQTAHSWANAGVLLGARMHRERGSSLFRHKILVVVRSATLSTAAPFTLAVTQSRGSVTVCHSQSAVTLTLTLVSDSVRLSSVAGSSSSSYNFSDALHMRSIMHCCWRGVRGCLNNFSGCYCKI